MQLWLKKARWYLARIYRATMTHYLPNLLGLSQDFVKWTVLVSQLFFRYRAGGTDVRMSPPCCLVITARTSWLFLVIALKNSF